MAVPVDPYTFQDGPGNTASGEQVNERFDPLYDLLDHGITADNLDSSAALITSAAQLGSSVVSSAKLGVFPALRARRGSTNQNIDGGANTLVIWDDKSSAGMFDTDSMLATPSSTITIVTTGIYIVNANIRLNDISGSTPRRLTILHNDVEVAEIARNNPSGSIDTLSCGTSLKLTAADTIKVRVYSDAANRVEASTRSNISLVRICAAP